MLRWHGMLLTCAISCISRRLHLAGGAVVLFLGCLQAAEPQFQSLVPGLTVRPLPVRLKNINSVDYGPDQRLYAAGYDGRIWALKDTDGDGLEDAVTPFWSTSGDLLAPVGMVATRQGVFVAARGRLALLKDTDGDGRADQSVTVASGWVKEKHNSDTRNDASGVALDAEGNLYFSLGCMSYDKAWQLDGSGQSQYDPDSERGAILKVSPDFKQREILRTGERFIIGMEFNKHGDLFATDQEGDTWFPGGNPRDELLHIVPGRHYGFPFRHPIHLPHAVDEPEVIGFSPQHQSACGFRFNEARAGREPFGPAFWEGNAMVTGFSRGKPWRAPLVKTLSGYVGKQIQVLAFLCSEDPVAKREGKPTGVMLREYWLDVSGNNLASLTGRKDFPEQPSGSSLVTRFEGPTNWKEHYGTRLRGLIHPPQTGDYVFWVAADDHAELWLSDREDPAGKRRLVTLNRWTRPRDWEAYPEQASEPVRLEAGRRYYIELLHAEATADDALAVGWRLPDGTLDRPIPGRRLSSGR